MLKLFQVEVLNQSGGLNVLTTKLLQRTNTFLVFCNRNTIENQQIFFKEHQREKISRTLFKLNIVN